MNWGRRPSQGSPWNCRCGRSPQPGCGWSASHSSQLASAHGDHGRSPRSAGSVAGVRSQGSHVVRSHCNGRFSRSIRHLMKDGAVSHQKWQWRSASSTLPRSHLAPRIATTAQLLRFCRGGADKPRLRVTTAGTSGSCSGSVMRRMAVAAEPICSAALRWSGSRWTYGRLP
jgi:hypothetical protein